MSDTNLQRARFEEAIRNGGVVYYSDANGQNKIITSMEDIPSDAELAKGNPERESQALSSIKARMLQLQAEAESIGGFKEETTTEAPRAEATRAEAPKATAKKVEDK
jgi:hypothetical protein